MNRILELFLVTAVFLLYSASLATTAVSLTLRVVGYDPGLVSVYVTLVSIALSAVIALVISRGKRTVAPGQ